MTDHPLRTPDMWQKIIAGAFSHGMASGFMAV
ncbi:hypothetical protein GGR37_002496 [Novosphingobium taihuense]|uniref:Uncharacterized protein n=1 Tax=Novosphingobium taihuense TaxID=260085 RepID=A0A7W7EWE8_9SPHN|nr:hypothetical protein [Novosphingobium taihuense]